MKRERDEGLDAVKGFAIILVMIGHCIILNGLHDQYIYDAIAAVQMPLFMLISGYITGMKRRNVHHPEVVLEEEDENIIHTAKLQRIAQFGRVRRLGRRGRRFKSFYADHTGGSSSMVGRLPSKQVFSCGFESRLSLHKDF